jgi:hypothetical protein
MRLAPDCVAEGVCRDLDCRAVDAWRQHHKRIQEQFENYLEQARAATVLRDERSAADGIAKADEFFVTVIPLFARPVDRLPVERREEFRENITALVRQVGDLLAVNSNSIERTPPDNDETSKPAADGELLAGAVCAACRGYCCRHGDTHAYLHADTLQGLLQRRPEMRAEELVETYLGFLPEQSFVGSCVFHGEQGCALPRAMRSDTCNRHLCAGQQDLAAALKRGAPPRAFVAISDEKEIVDGRFVRSSDH